MLLSEGIDLKEQSPYGKPWGKCTKHELVRMILNLASTVQQKNEGIYWNSLFQNPCHQIYTDEYKEKQLNKVDTIDN